MHRLRYLLGLAILAGAAAGAWWFVALLRQMNVRDGMAISVEFRDARGLRPGADVRYRGVRVGIVRSVEISADGDKAVVGLLLDPPGALRATVGSAFWVAAPRFAGLAGGASGLDTLVRDAYVSFATPPGEASPLMAGSWVVGREKPPTLEPEALEDLEPGDLTMTLLVPENHGLRPGAAVVFRGMQTGDVREVGLAADGSFVEVQLRIQRQHRQTVTDKTQFWVARPHVSGALFSGFTVSDVSALVTPFVSYYTEPGLGVLVDDGFRAAAQAARPDREVAAVPKAALERPAAAPAREQAGLVLVRVVYSAVDRDWLSSDDPIDTAGSGLFFHDAAGRALVATARSVVDGRVVASDAFGGEPDVVDEQIKVRLADGRVLRASRVWVDPAGADLAVLMVEGVPRPFAGTPAAQVSLPEGAAAATAPTSLARLDADGKAVTVPFDAPGALLDNLGAVVCVGKDAVAIYGRAAPGANTAALVPLTLLPADLRPQ